MNHQFEDLKASELFCPRCKTAQPVREKLLLVLPHAELHDYKCVACGESLGSREVRVPPNLVAPRAATPGRRPRRR